MPPWPKPSATTGRLETVSYDGTLVSTYGYDVNSNRTSYDGPFGTVTELDTDYDARDRLRQYGDTDYTYNEAGELTSKSANGQAVTYDTDVFGNLRRVSLPSGTTIDYVIDAAQRRIGKQVDGTLTRGWLYQDGLNPIAELDGTGNVVTRFVYATRPNVPDYLIKNGATYRVVSDHLGSPRLIVDVVTGVIVQELRYDAFGRVTLDTNPGFQPFGFAGGLYDPQTGLIRFGARDYDPEIGRWTTMDPIGFGGGLNHYSYSNQNPVNYSDPAGNVPLIVAAGLLWGGVELGLSLWDLWETGTTLADPCAPDGEKIAAAGGMLLGMALPGGGYGAGGKALASATSKGADGATTLYRAVSKAELDDIASNGLRTKSGGYESGKLFATNLSDASRFGRNNFQLDGIPNHLIEVDVPSSVMAGVTKFRADSMDAVLIPAGDLSKLRSASLNFSPVGQ